MLGRVPRKRARELVRELGGNPFFPLLFIGEATKSVVYHLYAGEPAMDVTVISVVMAVLSVVGWLYASADVAWGLYQAAEETAEDVTDGSQ